MSTATSYPHCVVVLSGKRKSGKDFIADKLLERYSDEICTVLRLSGPLKKHYAEEHGLNFEELLKASAYKESYRADMIKWGEAKRNKEPFFFCNKTVELANKTCRLWVISDARRKTDVQFFRENYHDKSVFVRIEADDITRRKRGFIFTDGIDDAESECGLDEGMKWDFIIDNSEDTEKFSDSMGNLFSWIDAKIR